jgi:hypothetical protein
MDFTEFWKQRENILKSSRRSIGGVMVVYAVKEGNKILRMSKDKRS